jgi:hypothetical protein
VPIPKFNTSNRPPTSPIGATGHVRFDKSRRLCFSESDLPSETDQDEITVNSMKGGMFRYPESVSAFCYNCGVVKRFQRGGCGSCGTKLSIVYEDVTHPVGLPD